MTPSPGLRRQEVLGAWVWFALLALLMVAVAGLTVVSHVATAIAAPLAVLLVSSATLAFVLWRRRRGLVPWFEIGVVYAGIVTLYGAYPLIKMVVVGEHYYAPALDMRWSILAPVLSEVVSTGWLYAFHLVAFVAVYLLVRGQLPMVAAPMVPPTTPVFLSVVALYAIVQGFWIYLSLFYDTSADSYIETYLVSRRLPLLLAQLLNHLNGAKYPISLVILAGLFARYHVTRRYIVAWVAVLAALTFVRLGSRTDLALLVMATGMMYHTLVRPLTPRTVALGVGGGITAFVVLGMLRAGIGAGGGWVNPFQLAGEFDIVFGNALELARVKAAGTLGPLPMAFYLADLAALLPQQIAPFEKIEPATWYVNRFYPIYADWGGGMAFGTMAEAALTGGWFGAAARGAALGACFALIHRLFIRHAHNYWMVVFYVWATTLSYQALRGTTFMLLVLFAFRFLPIVVGVTLLTVVLERAALKTRLRVQAAPPTVAPGASRVESTGPGA